ncbi:MAG: CHASE2 domain-containing protein [Cyanobacteria bacterium J06639_14]
MSKRIVLTLLQKSEQGYPASLNIHSQPSASSVIQVTGILPSIPSSLQAALQSWQLPYRTLLESRAYRITPQAETQFSWPEKARTLVEALNHWLNSGAQQWQKIRDALLQTLGQGEATQLFLQTGALELQQLPWSAWDVLSRCLPAPEVILSPPEIHQSAPVASPVHRSRPRILVVLGAQAQLDLQRDRQKLAQFGQSGVDIQYLDQPDRQTFLKALWDEQGWDIFYFGGHSGAGLVGLNQQAQLAPHQDFKQGMREAIAKGLQLAIFNSCDGLPLANELAQLNLPRSIVMREPVPDKVAQDFLAFLLSALERGQTLAVSVQEARRKLEDAWTYQYPGCSWLPVIFQHPGISPFQWSTPAIATPDSPPTPPPFALPRGLGWLSVAAISLVVTSLVVGVRSLGGLQSWELWWFDQLMRLRPAELPDDRITIITVGESDIQYQQQNGLAGRGSMSDAALAQLLQKLTPHQPRVIGLDIYHDFEYEPELAAQLTANSQFIAPCKVSKSNTQPDSIAGPPQIPIAQIGFTNFPSDPNTFIRRQLIGMATDGAICSTPYAFSVKVALAYLGSDYEVAYQPQSPLTIGDTLFPRLQHMAGGYNLNPDDANGYQILINYRSQSPRQISLATVLKGEVDDQLGDWVRDRILLIGPDDTKKDIHLTPYSQGAYPEKMLGIEIHAQMTSQILSAVLDQRSLLWWYPEWFEWLWIYSWSFIGGLILWRLRSVLGYSLVIGATVIGLPGICFIFLLSGGWVPLVPCALGIFSTSSIFLIYIRFS